MARANPIWPLESNGAAPVNQQDQATRLLDLYFLKAFGPPFTALTVDGAPGDKTITVASTTNFVAGRVVGLTCPTCGYFYFGKQVGAPVGNVITLDTPLDNYFYISDTNVFAATDRLNVDGSVTPQIFQVGPVGSTAGLVVDITRIAGYIESATSMDDGKFGDLAALTNGIVLRRKFNGTYQNIWNAKTNGQMALICASDFNYTTKPPAGTVYGARFRNSFNGPEKHGVVVRLDPGEILELVVQDNLSTLSDFNMMAQGHFTQN